MIGQWTMGITNKLTDNLYLFFYEYDNVELKFVEFDAKLISEKGEIDVYILESSPNNYHLVSLDIISRERLIQLQNYVTMEGDYTRLQDEELFFPNRAGFNVLRLGEKMGKHSPQFIDLVKCGKNNLKSLEHYKLYRFFCNIPEIKNLDALNIPTRLILYKTRCHK